jgi:hypothetical protein
LHEWRRAADDASLALTLNPAHVKSWMRRAAARNGLGQHEAALRDLSVVLAFEPGNREAAAEMRKGQEAVKACAKRLPAVDVTPVARGAGWVDLPAGDAAAAAAFAGSTVVVVSPPAATVPVPAAAPIERPPAPAPVPAARRGSLGAIHERAGDGGVGGALAEEAAGDDEEGEGGGDDAAAMARLAAGVAARTAKAGARVAVAAPAPPSGKRVSAKGAASAAMPAPAPAVAPIRTGYEFERAWRASSRGDAAAVAAARRELLLGRVQPSAWPALFPLPLDADLASAMAESLLAADAGGDDRVAACLAGLLAMRGLPVTLAMCDPPIVTALGAAAERHGLGDVWRRIRGS